MSHELPNRLPCLDDQKIAIVELKNLPESAFPSGIDGNIALFSIKGKDRDVTYVLPIANSSRCRTRLVTVGLPDRTGEVSRHHTSEWIEPDPQGKYFASVSLYFSEGSWWAVYELAENGVVV